MKQCVSTFVANFSRLSIGGTVTDVSVTSKAAIFSINIQFRYRTQHLLAFVHRKHFC